MILSLLDQIPLGIFVLRHDYTVMHWNTFIEQWSQVQSRSIVGTNILDMYPHLANPKYLRRLEQVFQQALPVIFSWHLHQHIIPCPLAGGMYRLQHTTVTPLQSEPQEPWYALFSIQDITDITKQTQKYHIMRDRALREAEERARVEATVRVLNEELEQRVSQRTLEIHTINQELTKEVSEKRQAEIALRSSEQLLSLIFDTVNVGLSVVNQEGCYIRVNKAYSRILGFSNPAELIGKQFIVMYPPEEHSSALERLQELFHNPAMQEIMGERALVSQHGDSLDVFFTTTKFTTEFGEHFAITAITDVSILRRAEREVRATLQKEKDLHELKSHFVSLVSHEFRTPMTIILSSVEILQHTPGLPPEKHTALFTRITTSIQRMTELLEDIFFIEKSSQEGVAFRPQAHSLPDICAQIIDEAKTVYFASRNQERKINALVRDDTESQNHQVFIDEQLVRYILLNLLLNAFKYSPADSDVVFEVRYSEHAIIFVIQDFGIGIPEDDLPKIFELFHRGKNIGHAPGTGLGLAIVKRSVDAHGGLIECESSVGKGSRFTVHLPRINSDEAQKIYTKL